MTQINISRIFDTGVALATQAGQQLNQMITFLSLALNQILLALKNGLKFEDNLYGEVKLVTLTHGKVQPITLASANKTPKHMFVTRCYSTTEPMPMLAWYTDSSGNLTLVAYFYSVIVTPTATKPTLQLQIVIEYN